MKKVIMLFMMIGLLFLTESCEDNNYLINTNPPVINESNTQLIIDLKGAVRLPNIYSVKEGTILYELINLAGGLDKNADVSSINLALILNENQMITIPYKKSELDNTNQSTLVNINTASIEELCTLPGIGTSKATSIINYRNSNGYFISIEDVKKVSGISEGLFTKIKDYISV